MENKTQKKLRTSLWGLYLVEIMLTLTPYMGDDSQTYSVASMIIRPQGYGEPAAVKLAVIGALFIVIPFVAMMFCLLDKKSNIKNLVSFICSLVGIGLITFGLGAYISLGSMLALLLYLVTAFITVLSLMVSIMKK